MMSKRQGYGDNDIPAPVTIPPTSTTQLNAATSTGPALHYTQIFNDAVRGYAAAEVNDAPFTELCAGDDCFKACQDFGLLFNKDHYEYQPNAKFPTSFSDEGITLFGLCTNTANITDAIAHTDTLPNAANFFKSQDTAYNVNKVVSGTAQCLVGSCEATRKPDECRKLCSSFVIQQSISTLDFAKTYTCMAKLCDNTCGLPYANQDVMGVGVLGSYTIQVIIIIAYGIFCATRFWRRRRKLKNAVVNKVHTRADKINTAAGAFFVAQCFFAVSAAMASFISGPEKTGLAKIDPINGYALLFVATIGFIQPVMMFMLLHTQKRREWYHIFAVSLSWLMSTVLFFILFINLKNVTGNSHRVAQARNALFEVEACGGYSAMSLCTETGKSDPINFMMGFFNEDKIPNINNIWTLWLGSFFTLVTIFSRRAFLWYQRRRDRLHSSISSAGSKLGAKADHTLPPMKPINRWAINSLVLATVFFAYCIIYQVLMVVKYIEMDLIDRTSKGWTFGQLVAMLLWAPALFEFTLGWMLEKFKARHDKKYSYEQVPQSVMQTPLIPAPATPSVITNPNMSVGPLSPQPDNHSSASSAATNPITAMHPSSSHPNNRPSNSASGTNPTIQTSQSNPHPTTIVQSSPSSPGPNPDANTCLLQSTSHHDLSTPPSPETHSPPSIVGDQRPPSLIVSRPSTPPIETQSPSYPATGTPPPQLPRGTQPPGSMV